MKLYKLLLGVIVTLLIININVDTYAVEAQSIPTTVRVGLYYLTSAVNSVDLTSEKGFNVGYTSNETFKKLALIQSTKLTAKKDNHTLAGASDPAAYHISTNKTYKTYTEAYKSASDFAKLKYNAFPVYEKGWKVWIGIYSSKTNANLDITKLKKSFTTYTFSVIEPNASRIQLVDTTGKVQLVFSSDIDILELKPVDGDGISLVGVNGTKYRGSIRLIRNAKSDMTVVNVVTLEEYLYSVVTSEMPSGWHIEALKAQTLAARTYAVHSLKNSARSRDVYLPIGFDMTNTTEFQVYDGYIEECEASRKAVDETKGQIMYYNNEPINAVFFSSDGGYTEDSENVWSNKVPYLRAVQDKYLPADFSKKSWSVKVTAQQIKDFYKTKNIDIGDIVDIQDLKYSKSKNVIYMKVIGTKGEWVYEKGNVRAFLGGSVLFSQNFRLTKEGSSGRSNVITSKLKKTGITLDGQKALTKAGKVQLGTDKPINVKSKTATQKLESKPQTFVFTGSGWGHGVGLSQWGAKGMADKGFKYDEIVKHYYTGIEIK